MSYDNCEIEKTLKNAGASLLGPLKYARVRTPTGKLTNFKTGDRSADKELPAPSLPKNSVKVSSLHQYITRNKNKHRMRLNVETAGKRAT